MPFEDFIAILEEETGNKLDQQDISEFKYTGLNNIEFYKARDLWSK